MGAFMIYKVICSWVYLKKSIKYTIKIYSKTVQMGESLSSFLEVKDYFETLSEYSSETLATSDITTTPFKESKRL